MSSPWSHLGRSLSCAGKLLIAGVQDKPQSITDIVSEAAQLNEGLSGCTA